MRARGNVQLQLLFREDLAQRIAAEQGGCRSSFPGMLGIPACRSSAAPAFGGAGAAGIKGSRGNGWFSVGDWACPNTQLRQERELQQQGLWVALLTNACSELPPRSWAPTLPPHSLRLCRRPLPPSTPAGSPHPTRCALPTAGAGSSMVAADPQAQGSQGARTGAGAGTPSEAAGGGGEGKPPTLGAGERGLGCRAMSWQQWPHCQRWPPWLTFQGCAWVLVCALIAPPHTVGAGRRRQVRTHPCHGIAWVITRVL